MAFTFLPGVRISGEPAGGEALRVERGVEGEDIVDCVVSKELRVSIRQHRYIGS